MYHLNVLEFVYVMNRILYFYNIKEDFHIYN